MEQKNVMDDLIGPVGVVGEYEVICRGVDGEIKWIERIKNTFVNSGLNYLLYRRFVGT